MNTNCAIRCCGNCLVECVQSPPPMVIAVAMHLNMFTLVFTHIQVALGVI